VAAGAKKMLSRPRVKFNENLGILQ
jgi:hypothetical protein